MRPRVRPATSYSAWIPAVVLIGVGLIFLAQNYLGHDIHKLVGALHHSSSPVERWVLGGTTVVLVFLCGYVALRAPAQR